MATTSELRQQLQGLVEGIRRNRVYTDEAKKVQLARVYLEHQQQIDSLRSKALDDARQERSRLSRELFGLDALTRAGESRVSIAVSQRDARDRVAAVTTESEAAELLARAERNGDEVLTSALLERSVEQTWLAPLNAYVELHPSAEPKLQRLVDMHASSSARTQLQFEMEHALDKPIELQGTTDYDLGRLAESTAVGSPA